MELRTVLAWSLAACVLLAAVPGPVWTDLASAGHGSPVNATAVWGSNEPGARNVSLTAYASGAAESATEGLEVWKNFTTVAPAAIGYTCTPQRDVRAAGVDRGDDDPGTETDESMLGKFKYYQISENEADQTILTIVFYDEDDFGGQTIHLNHTDQLIAKFAGCWHTPDEPGWYRNYGHVNGTTWSGTYGETDSFSHWYYFCEGCESYDAAVAALGPPPEGNLANSDQSVGRMTGPHYLVEPGERDGVRTPAPTGTPTEAAPDTPSADHGTTDGTAPSPTEPTGGSAGPATDASNSGADPPSTAAGTATGTSPPASTTEPSSGDGPGFGVFAAVVALLAGMALARAGRRE